MEENDLSLLIDPEMNETQMDENNNNNQNEIIPSSVAQENSAVEIFDNTQYSPSTQMKKQAEKYKERRQQIKNSPKKKLMKKNQIELISPSQRKGSPSRKQTSPTRSPKRTEYKSPQRMEKKSPQRMETRSPQRTESNNVQVSLNELIYERILALGDKL